MGVGTKGVRTQWCTTTRGPKRLAVPQFASSVPPAAQPASVAHSLLRDMAAPTPELRCLDSLHAPECTRCRAPPGTSPSEIAAVLLHCPAGPRAGEQRCVERGGPEAPASHPPRPKSAPPPPAVPRVELLRLTRVAGASARVRRRRPPRPATRIPARGSPSCAARRPSTPHTPPQASRLEAEGDAATARVLRERDAPALRKPSMLGALPHRRK